MSALPDNARTIDLLKWVAANPNKPFDPNMVVSLSTGHTWDWEWQAVLGQMEDLRLQNYVTKLRQDAAGSTYWTITTKGTSYLHALESSESRAPNVFGVTTGGMSMEIVGGWERLGEPIGEGGQGHVYLVRKPSRVDERKAAIDDLHRDPWGRFPRMK